MTLRELMAECREEDLDLPLYTEQTVPISCGISTYVYDNQKRLFIEVLMLMEKTKRYGNNLCDQSNDRYWYGTVESPEELKPCPFCGPGMSQVSCYQDECAYWVVGCGRCGSHSGIRPPSDVLGREKVIRLWNTRVSE